MEPEMYDRNDSLKPHVTVASVMVQPDGEADAAGRSERMDVTSPIAKAGAAAPRTIDAAASVPRDAPVRRKERTADSRSKVRLA
jgi:hypothetical protein